MALHLAEGFEGIATADLSAYYEVGWGTPTVGAYGRSSTQGLKCPAGGTNIVFNLSAELTAFVSGFAFRPTVLGDDHIAQLVDGHDFIGGPILTLHVDADGSIEIRRGLTTYGYLVTIGTNIWTSPPNKVRANAWNTIEWKGVIDASAGYVSLKVNGELLCDLGPIRTTGDGSSNVITRASIGCHAHEIWFDDWWLLDQDGARLNDFLGDRIVEDQVAIAGNGTYAEWTPSTGSDHGAMVDETPHDGDTTYNAADTVGLRDLYTFPALTRLDAVDSVQCSMVMRRDGIGARAVELLTRQGGTDTLEGTDLYLAADYAAYRVNVPVNPTTGDPWTVSELNAAEQGPQVMV